MIVEKVNEYMQSQISQWPCKSNRASELGHDCELYLVLMRTKWQEKTLHDIGLQYIFNEGNIHEPAIMALLQRAGIQTIEQQRAFDWPKYNITGHIDAKLVNNGSSMPLEIKTCSPYMFDSIHSVNDLLHGKYMYLRKYPAQLTLYMLMDNTDKALFLFKNKVNGQLKEIPIELDYDYAEQLIQKAERINKHVEAGTLPEPIDYDEQTCGGCGFKHLCLVEIKRDALEITDDPEIEEKLDRLQELKPLKSEYEKLDKEVKKIFKEKEKEKIVIGSYLITGNWIERKGFTVNAGTYWKTNISKL